VQPPLIDIKGLAKRYGDFTAVSDLDLAVGAGELFALLGPNGAGKTTTIRMLMGILQPSAGSARIAGHDCFSERVEVMRHIGYLPDEPVFYDYLRGREIVRFVGEMHGLDRAEIERRAAPLITRLELADATEEFAVNYSKGMKKKLALLCALLPEPEVLILDEPTNGLDPYATRALHELMREQVALGRTLFFSTHLLDQAERLCHRVGIVFRSRLVAVGTIAELRARVAATGAPATTLEEIFFALTGDRADAAPGAALAPAPAPA
jgi:ABC-2 type transport system ATP-binding protein